MLTMLFIKCCSLKSILRHFPFVSHAVRHMLCPALTSGSKFNTSWQQRHNLISTQREWRKWKENTRVVLRNKHKAVTGKLPLTDKDGKVLYFLGNPFKRPKPVLVHLSILYDFPSYFYGIQPQALTTGEKYLVAALYVLVHITQTGINGTFAGDYYNYTY